MRRRGGAHRRAITDSCEPHRPVGSVIHCASSRGANGLAGQRSRSGGRKDDALDAPKPRARLYHRRPGKGRWNITLGAGGALPPLPQLGSEVGYESEAAFNRAFKREFECPPARFRSQSRAALEKPFGADPEFPQNGASSTGGCNTI